MAEKLTTIRLNGGLGKHIVFTALLSKLCEKFGKLNIISPYPEVFIPLEMVEASIFIDDYENNMQEFAPIIKEIIAHDPYSTEFAFDDKHILTKWAEMFDIVYDGELPLTSMPIEGLPEPVTLPNKFIVVQFSGGQSPVGFQDTQVYQSTPMIAERNYPFAMAQILVNKLHVAFPEHEIINCSLPNEYQLEGTIHLPVPFYYYYEIVKYADQVICIDSMLQHIAATTSTPTTVLWNSAAWNPSHKYGWVKDSFTNLEQPHMTIDYNDIVNSIKEST